MDLLQNYLRFHYSHPQIQDSELTENLPSNLRRKVMFELYGNRLQDATIFRVNNVFYFLHLNFLSRLGMLCELCCFSVRVV